MKVVIDGYNKSIHKKDNQIVIHERDQILDSIKASKLMTLPLLEKDMLPLMH